MHIFVPLYHTLVYLNSVLAVRIFICLNIFEDIYYILIDEVPLFYDLRAVVCLCVFLISRIVSYKKVDGDFFSLIISIYHKEILNA